MKARIPQYPPSPLGPSLASLLFTASVGLASFLGLASCAGSSPGPPGPAVDGAAIAEEALAATRPEGAVRLVFRWRLQEPGARFTGDGVIRMEEPYRARLDLFTDRGEGAAIAALVEDELRLPPGALDVPLPPPPLFWATAGVFRPGSGAKLLGASARNGGSLLRYGLPDGRELHFLMTGSRIDRVELRVNNSVEEEVRLEWSRDGRVPSSVRYRLMRETRELSTTLEQIEDVDAFPPGIWTPNA